MIRVDKNSQFSDLEELKRTMYNLTYIAMSSSIDDYERSRKAEAFLNEIEELDSELYSDYTIRFINKSTLTRLKDRGYYPGKYNGDYIKVFDVYDSCIPKYEEDYLVFITDYRDI